jgi:nucleoid-associated protein YgaU
VRGERDNGGEAHKPGILKEDDLKPGHDGPSTGSSGGMSQPGTTGQPEVMTPPAGGGLPAKDENVPNPARTQEPPAPPAESPASEPTPSRSQETAARHEPVGGLGSSPSEPSVPTARPARDLAESGWVRIPNKGRIPSSSGVDPDAFGGAGGRDSDRARDGRRQADPGLGYEPESPANRSADANERAVAESASSSTGLVAVARGVRPSGGSRADAGSTRVEPSLHIVERGENFWTISRLYYGTGRYYRALWRANSRTYPNIDEIHINDVVEIPAVEDLDPNDFERPNRRPIAGRDEGSARGLADGGAPGGAEPRESYPTTRTARTSGGGDGIPVRRSAGAAPELELPASDAGAGLARVGRGVSGDRSDADEDRGPATAIRSTARPRNTARVDRPVYKVRRYDTLRSIARDILGDPRRADEILDLNRDIIDDPTHLTTGQILELPEDADTRRLTVRDRYRGRD